MSLRDLIFSQSSQQQHSIPSTTTSINNNSNSYNATSPTVIPTAASVDGVTLSNKTNVTKSKNSRRQQITKTSAITPPSSKSSSKVHDVKVPKYSTSYSDVDAIDDSADDDNDDTVDEDDDYDDDGNFEDEPVDHQNDNIYESGERNLILDVPKKR